MPGYRSEGKSPLSRVSTRPRKRGSAGASPSRTCWSAALEEDVPFFAVLAQVEPLNFVALADAQAHDGVEHLEEDECAHHGEHNGGSSALRLIDELLGVAFEPAPGSGTSG